MTWISIPTKNCLITSLRPLKKVESQLTFVSHALPERRRLSAPPAYDDTETTYFHYALLSGDGVHNVAIQGTGAIDGNRPSRGGPKPIGIKNSDWISVRGITIRNAPNYNISFAGTDHIEVEGVKLISGFADGVDFDGCRYARAYLFTGLAYRVKYFPCDDAKA